jgi:lysophospholipid acyltransferase (LPLAT)-like uncharacterized protein
MANSSSLAMKLGGLAAASFVRTWMGSLDIQEVTYDPTTHPSHAEFREPIICAFWHEYLMAPFHLGGHTHTAILTSRHRDANWIAEASRHLGFDAIRGSTNRGGSRAMLEFLRTHGARNLGIACDGPLGPRRCMAQGPIYLSSRLQIPLVLWGVGYDRPWRMPTWDQFAVPRPGSRARLVVGPRMQIPAKLNRAQLAHYRERAEAMLLRLTFEAEAWAAEGTRKRAQYAARLRPAPPRNRSVAYAPTRSKNTPRPALRPQAA